MSKIRGWKKINKLKYELKHIGSFGFETGIFIYIKKISDNKEYVIFYGGEKPHKNVTGKIYNSLTEAHLNIIRWMRHHPYGEY